MHSLVAGWRIGSMAVLVIVFASSCSRTHAGKDRGPGHDTMGGGGGAASSAGEGGGGVVGGPEERPRVASNGVLIPNFETVTPEPCGALGVEDAQCSSKLCKSVVCSCEHGSLSFPGECFPSFDGEIRCLTSISCAAACAAAESVAEPDPVFQVALCLSFGLCATDVDCDDGRCVRSPGQERGACWRGTHCYEDADCGQGACVVGADRAAKCADRSIGAACNLDVQCAAPARCLLEDGAFAGVCSDGADDAPCLADGDCEGLHQCVTLADSSHVCSRHVLGSPCGSTEDCLSGYCVEEECSTGELGAPCVQNSDCESPSHCVDPGFGPVCSDGKAGSPCIGAAGSAGDCAAGLYCSPRETCASGVAGDACYGNSECLNAKCVHGTCTDGKLGQTCRGIYGCEAGLRCIGELICASGADGDPCAGDEECLSGLCGDRADVDEAEVLACANYGGVEACGPGAACVSGFCLRRFCVGSGAGN